MGASKAGFLMFFLVFGLFSGAMAETAAHAALPYPTATTPKPIDRGLLTAELAATPISVTIVLHLRDVNGAENLLTSLHTPGDRQFHQFLTADQFVARFAPTDVDVAKVVAALGKYGLTAQRATATTLKVAGLPAEMEGAFSVSLHSYEVPAHDNVPGYTFHAPLSRAIVPAEISAEVAAVVGLDSRPRFHPSSRTVPSNLKMAGSVPQTTTPDAPGYWTVIDFADYYDVQPLYRAGVSGSGRTIGIVTLASFTPSDAFAYWSALGLSVNPNRIQIVNVDGGPGAPSDASDSLETTLDVEQSGGVAPGANIIVYQAPDTGQGFVDDFAAAVDANSAETLSASWTSDWELFDNLENGPVIDPTTGQTVGTLQADHELFVRAAIQGQTVFAVSGDGGAYNANNYIGCYGPYSPSNPNSCSMILSLGDPASDPAVTAAGGTTLPGAQEFPLANGAPFYVYVPHERVWGWDYLEPVCAALGYPTPIACGIFPAGSGGGVSIMFREPFYQFGLPGTQLSRPGQVWEAGAAIVAELLSPPPSCLLNCSYYDLPPYYPGRNVPDISFNADPDTGYVIYYTSSVTGFGILSYWGGTSFVAPQLNGVSALLGQLLGSRLGLLNYPLYYLALTGQAYSGPNAPLHAIRYGDNWFYHGRDGYNPAVGLGTLDVWNFAKFLRREF
ncbi:MAG TPA: S53 family peptidase [Terriglobales bacterium]|nr:S53 family peptidase [Terriglobales bacterium]